MCQIRTKFCFAKRNQPAGEPTFSYEVQMPGRVQVSDGVDAQGLIPEDHLPTEFEGLIYGLLFQVESVEWKRDAAGIYLLADCLGD